VHSWIGRGTDNSSQPHAARAASSIFEKLDFLVVQDMFAETDTAREAHLVLPAAGWGEKEGTFINSERRFGNVKKVARAPGQALADFHIFRLISHYWGCDGLFREWTSPQAAFQILKRLSSGRPCDITGIEDYRHLDREGGIQWPFTSEMNETCRSTKGQETETESQSSWRERRLFADGKFFTTDGKAKFLYDVPREQPEKPDAEYPFTLMTGRGSSAQWHTLTRTNKSEVLAKLGPRENYVEIHPQDAARLRIRSGQRVSVTSRRASIRVRATITATVQRGQVFMPMHFPETNLLTLAVFDPHSRQPSYKACAVKIG
jgi:assimilatory nitrate reductase catalytic subunit